MDREEFSAMVDDAIGELSEIEHALKRIRSIADNGELFDDPEVRDVEHFVRAEIASLQYRINGAQNAANALSDYLNDIEAAIDRYDEDSENALERAAEIAGVG